MARTWRHWHVERPLRTVWIFQLWMVPFASLLDPWLLSKQLQWQHQRRRLTMQWCRHWWFQGNVGQKIQWTLWKRGWMPTKAGHVHVYPGFTVATILDDLVMPPITMANSSPILGTNSPIFKSSTSVPTMTEAGQRHNNSGGPFESFDYSLMHIVYIRDIEKHWEYDETLNAVKFSKFSPWTLKLVAKLSHNSLNWKHGAQLWLAPSLTNCRVPDCSTTSAFETNGCCIFASCSPFDHVNMIWWTRRNMKWISWLMISQEEWLSCWWRIALGLLQSKISIVMWLFLIDIPNRACIIFVFKSYSCGCGSFT